MRRRCGSLLAHTERDARTGRGGTVPLTLCSRLLLCAAILQQQRPPPSRADKSAGQSGRSTRPRPLPPHAESSACSQRAASGGCPAHTRGLATPPSVTPPNGEVAGSGARPGGCVGPAPARDWGDAVRGWCPSRHGACPAVVCGVLALEGTAWFFGSTRAKYF